MPSLEYKLIGANDATGIEDARTLFQEYQQAIGLDLGFQGFDDEVQTLPGKYIAPSGCLAVVYKGEEAIGCGALRKLEDGIAELKRVYVRPTAQGLGLGRQISERLIQQARLIGYRRLRLDTFSWMDRAVELYRSLGFVDIEPYYSHAEPNALFMELDLASVSSKVHADHDGLS